MYITAAVYNYDLPRKLRKLGYKAAMDVLELSRCSINPKVPAHAYIHTYIHTYIETYIYTFQIFNAMTRSVVN